MRARFGDVVIDTESRQLWRNGASVHVSLKAFDLLSLLIRHRPVAVSKSDIQEHLWPSTFVAEGNIATVIAEIRAAIGETAQAPGVIRTVHRFGYAFEGDLHQEEIVGRRQCGTCLPVTLQTIRLPTASTASDGISARRCVSTLRRCLAITHGSL